MTTQNTGSDLASIQAELARTGLSATTMNFIVWIDDPNHRDWVLARATMVGEKHPSRAVILDASAQSLDAKLVRSDRDEVTHPTIQGERVEIGAKGLSPEEIREITHSLTIPDLPTVLWWTGVEVKGQPVFDALVDIVDALVVDSSGGRTDAATLVELAGFLSRRPMVGLRDLAWMRLRPWQEMIAQFFDAPAFREELFSIQKLRIVSGSAAEALYLAGWLGSRLGWSVSGRDEFSDRVGTRIPLSVERQGTIRRVRSVEITTLTSVYSATVCGDEENVVVVCASGKAERPKFFVPLAAIDNASLLERAILEPATDEVFETALRMVGSLTAS